jgi:predicted phosphodiesterase
MMKIAILSDIHGNLPALQTVTADIEAWQPDLVVVNGDIVNRGPCSLACVHFVREKQATKDWQVISGNHEGFVLACGKAGIPDFGPAYEVAQFAHWTYKQLNGEREWLAQLPDEFNWLAPDGSELRVKHASMRSNREGLFLRDEDEVLQAKIAPAPAVYVTAHTHQTFIRQLAETLVVNIGAVGSPFDADHRPGYGRFTWDRQQGWQADIVRLPFDRAAIERDYVESGFLTEAGALVQLMLVELRKARGLLFRWGERHYEQVLAGKITIEESVWDILRDEDVRPFTGLPGWIVD